MAHDLAMAEEQNLDKSPKANDVDQCKKKAGVTATEVFSQALKVFFDANAGLSKTCVLMMFCLPLARTWWNLLTTSSSMRCHNFQYGDNTGTMQTT